MASGSTYRDAAARIRTRAGRELDTWAPLRQKGHPYLAAPNRHGQLVSDWTETFAPVLWRTCAPAVVPATLLVDEDELRYSAEGYARGLRAFYVLGAMGYDQYRRPYVASLRAVPRTGIAAWTSFLASMPGSPSWIVGDRGWPIKAAQALWDNGDDRPKFRACDWHLSSNLESKLPTSMSKEDPFRKVLRSSFSDLDSWVRLERALQDRGFNSTLTYYNSIAELVRGQILTRRTGLPNSVGPLEEFFHQVDLTIGNRASKMTNQSRANALLDLLAMGRNGWVDEIQWAEIIREYLATLRGKPPDQRRHTDPRSKPSLR